MFDVDLENPRIFAASTLIVWVVIGGGIEVILFDGNLRGAVVPASAGGLAFALVYLLRENVTR